MIIDPKHIEEAVLQDFKGGKGPFLTRNYVDDKCKIMFSTLPAGSSSGLHTHTGNCEIVYVISGTPTFIYDGGEEQLQPGQVHYCPEGHSHYMQNRTDADITYLAIVPELRR